MASTVLACFLLISTLLHGGLGADEVEFSYDAQEDWPDVCVTGNTMRQSPINIVTEDVEDNDDLIALELSDAWGTPFDGTFVNGAHNVQFNPDFSSATVPTTTNHRGTYELAQFHFHWGRGNEEGSEHLVNSAAEELEIHFVHTLQNGNDATAGDYITVVGVFAEVDPDAELTGPWALLNATAVRELDSNISVSGLNFSMLMPAELDYYYYMGSLTTPPCSEIVQWFVLKERITVPGAYLAELRQLVGPEEGDVLTFNFREPQELAGRNVYMYPSSQAIVKPFISLLLTCLVAIRLF